MDQGTYASASAGFAQLRKLDIVNNNLANVNTPGFKKQILVGDVQSFEQTLAARFAANDPYAELDHDRVEGVVNLQATTDFSVGPIRNTENPLDAALLSANQFFVVAGEGGELQYTRAGNFTLNDAGALVTQDGFLVQGDGGAIEAGQGKVTIAPGGQVLADGNEVGRLQVVSIENTENLERLGATRFRLTAGAAEAVDSPSVEPRALEMSNVSTISSVIDLITASRGFEMYTKSARSIDEMNQTAINQLGKRQG
jgi:flagellar basal-body rod protein FlgG